MKFGGYALHFDGGDYVYLGSHTLLNPMLQYTIEAWVKPDAPTMDFDWVFTRWNKGSTSTYL